MAGRIKRIRYTCLGINNNIYQGTTLLQYICFVRHWTNEFGENIVGELILLLGEVSLVYKKRNILISIYQQSHMHMIDMIRH